MPQSVMDHPADILGNITMIDPVFRTKLITSLAKEASKKFMIFYASLAPAIYTRVIDSGILLTIRYLCAPRNRRGSEADIREEILSEFSLCPDIDFAYPTRRYYNNLREEKEGAGEIPPEHGAGSTPA